jgi:NTE family protein
MFSGKTLHSVKMSKAITYYLRLINDLYKMLKDHFDSNEKDDRKRFEKIRARYKKVTERHGAEIKGIHYITRSEPFPSLYENADFSIDTIKASIRDGELKTIRKLKDIRMANSVPLIMDEIISLKHGGSNKTIVRLCIRIE